MSDTYPDSPGFKEPTTSLEAARGLQARANSLRRKALVLLKGFGPMTPDELARLMCKTVLAIRPRVTELARMGLIERTGERRKNVSGMSAHVYRISNPRSGA